MRTMSTLDGKRRALLCNSDSKGPEIPSDLVFELLLRLPIKKLLQCMLVSKLWRSIIRHPRLIEAYYSNHSSCLDLLISIPEKKRLNFYYAPHGTQKLEKIDKLFHTSSFDYNRGTQVVNGLLCFYSTDQVYLGNVFTGEIMELPACSCGEGKYTPGPDLEASYYYSLGFDLVNRVYKLLYMSKVRKYELKILTVGGSDSSWRELQVAPDQFDFFNPGFYANGALYWVTCRRIRYHEYLSFNLSEEKFCDRPLQLERQSYAPAAGWVQFRGQLSVFKAWDGEINFYILEDNEGYAWSKHTVILPEPFQRSYNRSLVPIGSLSTGEIILTAEILLATNPTAVPIYSYNYINKKFAKLFLRKLPDSIDLKNKTDVAALISSVPENIETLKAMILGGMGSY